MSRPAGASPLDAVFLDAVSPIDPRDLGSGGALLVPNGLAFGALQWRRRGGRHWDWFRDEPDRHRIEGSRHSLHLGVDLAFTVRRGLVWSLPAGLPVRAPADGVIAAAHGSGAKELEPGGLMIAHGGAPATSVRPVTYLGDVRDLRRAGERVRRGDVVAETIAQSHRRVPRVVVHFGLALDVPGFGLVFVDPTALLRRWKIRHPVFPGSTCTPDRLAAARPGKWRAAGIVEGGVPAARFEKSWRSRY